jgi:putative nucleotidyltransferase with HDIG domain
MFGGLFGKGKKQEPPGLTDPPLAAAVSSAILNVVGAKSVPPMPASAQKAFQLSTDPNAEARDFIEVIESDEGLSARVLKIANSVYFDRGKKSTTIEESVLVIGINELRCLLNSNTLSEIFPSKHPARAFLWSHDVGTGLAARVLAQRLLPSKQELAFLGGLMHDIGKLLLLQRVPDEYAKVIARVEQSGIDFSVAEAELFPFDHTEVGQLIGERWGFTSELRTIIRQHHGDLQTLSQTGQPNLPSIIKLADLIAHSLGLGHPSTLHRFRAACEEKLPAAASALGVPRSDLPALLSQVKRVFETEYDLYVSGGG